MRFLVTQPAFINDIYIDARIQEPKEVSLPAGISLDHISRSWKPLDDEAVAALAKLGKKTEKASLPTAASVAAETKTMHEVQHGKKANRGADEAAVRVSSLPPGVPPAGAVSVTPAK